MRPVRLVLALVACIAVSTGCGAGSTSRPVDATPAPASTAPLPRLDIVVTRGRVLDGTGAPATAADVGIAGGRIVAVGDLAATPRARTIDAAGMVVAPGFIDMLGQSELTMLVDPRVPSKIAQGITTELTGEGGSAAPLNDAIVAADRPAYDALRLTPDWRTFRQYFARLEKQGMGINLGSYVGATQVRRFVLGDDDVQPSAAQLEAMKALVRDAMRDGAVGLSTALLYPPAPYAKTEELVALAAEVGKVGGIYASHIRDESDGVLAAIDEALRIGREGHVPVEIWHLKVAGRKNWGRMPEVVAKIEDARRRGVDVAADTYAYPAWFNLLSAIVPPWSHAGGDAKLVQRLGDPPMRSRIKQEILSGAGGWESEWRAVPAGDAWLVFSVTVDDLRPLQGKTLAQVGALWHEDALDAALDLLAKDHALTNVAVFGMNEPDVAMALAQPWVSVDVDSAGVSPEGLLGRDLSHPRAYGTFPRILRKYVREERLLTLQEAIRKFTSLPAQRMHLSDRGTLAPGKWADVVVFDPATVRDVATFENPNRLAEGMRFVLVNGVPVIDEGKMTGALPGRVVRGPAYAP
jgi:dihydroorotase/N-acyl-D-amino-acid deacylase